MRRAHRGWTYAKPCLVEVCLVVPGDDLLDEVARGGEMAALAEQEGGPVAADGRLSGVEDGVEVAVDPVVVARHHRRRRGDPVRSVGRDGRVEARRRKKRRGGEEK